jgi:polar amino acid transport system substrate-binding protein
VKRFTLTLISVFILASLVLGACASSGSQAPLKVVTDASWPPFEMVNESTKALEGFDVDLIKAIADKESMNIDIQNVPFDPLLAGMGTCQYDIAISAITITSDRAQKMAFSDPYFEAGQIVSVSIDNTDITGPESLAGKTVAAQIGTTGAIEVQKISGATLKTYDDIGLAFQDLLNGQVDAVVADNPLAIGYVGKNAAKLKTVGKVFTDENYGIAVCKNKQDVLDKINKGLAAVKSEGFLDQLTQKWIESGQ